MFELLTASLPTNYTAAASLTLAIPLSVLMVILGWWVWSARRRP